MNEETYDEFDRDWDFLDDEELLTWDEADKEVIKAQKPKKKRSGYRKSSSKGVQK